MTGKPPPVTIPPRVQQKSYRGLLGEKAWQRLHPDIRKRFDYAAGHKAICYEGVMKTVGMSTAGALLAQCCRLIGAPLALHRGHDIPIQVNVYPNAKLNGTTWDRLYKFTDKPWNRVRSTKCIQPESGLVEVVGFGFGMYLKISEKTVPLFSKAPVFSASCLG
jgi:hypothetical protein